MAHNRCNCYFPFWAIFCPSTPITARKMKISQKWKKSLEISLFYTCAPKIMIRWCTVPEIWCATGVKKDGQMDEQTGGWEKWHIVVGAPPKNFKRLSN